MQEKQLKLIYFSLNGSDAQEVLLSWKRIFSILSFVFVVMLLLVGAAIALFTDFYHNYRIEHLTRVNASLLGQLRTIQEKVSTLEGQIAFLEKENDDLRVFADMPPLNKDIRRVGVGGADEDLSLSMVDLPPDTLGTTVVSIHQKVEEIERRIQLYSEERKEILATLQAREETYKHLPSIRPVLEGRISDTYGPRLDPFTDVIKHHDGLDISAPVGTRVYAAAAGVVILAKNTYVPGKGYGKEVLIDHGNGLVTRYAHLSKILVTKGQKVDRWEEIGLVGETGKTTGPHLHYEVLVKGKPVDPNFYILD